MEFSSPPPAARRGGLAFDDIEDDEIVSESPYFTQPTQIVDRPTIRPMSIAPSSPHSIIEVPASSPFRPQPIPQRTGGRLASAMAPPGTSFRPPASRNVSVASKKREFVQISDGELDAPIYVGGDSSDDDTQPSRGDIRPSSFQRKEPSINVSTSSTSLAFKAQVAKSQASKSNTQESAGSPSNRLGLQKDWAALTDSSPSSDESLESLRKPSPPKQPPRRRLVQGRRPGRQASPASSPVKPVEKPRKVKVIDLVSDDDDRDEDYDNRKGKGRRSSPQDAEDDDDEEGSSEFDSRVLQYLNTCDVVQLVAIAGVKEDTAKLMVSHQPFRDLEHARRVTLAQKKKGKKSAKISVGDDIVAAVKSYAKSLDAIDYVIQACEKQARAIKASTAKWAIGETGQPKNDSQADDGKPLTPVSMEDPRLVDLPHRQPKYMDGHCVMKPFQRFGLNWMRLLHKLDCGGILADDMGLGKTCQVISLMCSVVEDFENGKMKGDRPWPNIIFVPPSTLANWAAEFKRFAPDINVITYQGPQAVRDEIAEEIQDDPEAYHVVLTSYSQLSRQDDISNLRRIQPKIAVFDEGHKMKNPKTKLYKDLLRITADWRLILSGTPVQNNLMEMIALLRFVEPKLFSEHFETLEALFSQKFSLADVSKGAILASERVPRARTILEPFILQRRKEQVLQDMPKKTTRVEYCKMDKNQASIYEDYARRFRKSAQSSQSAVVEKGRDNDTNNVWIQLRKSAIHPQLFRRFFKDKVVEEMAKELMKRIPQSELKQPNLGHLTNELKALSDFELHLWCRDYRCIRKFDLPDGSWGECAKVKSLLKLIRGYQKNGDRALVFTRFAKVIEILGECLASEGVEYLSLQGNTDVSERQELINQFNADETIPVFLLTTGSGGTGINLTAANKVIIFDQSDNPQDDIQAENRAHRLGQTRPVEIVRLISEGTVEELVYKACQKKLELANKVTGWSTGADVTAGLEMTSGQMEAEVKEMMKKGGTPPDSD
ncbi:SNF2 family N-terminal domain-containing protein [Triangularia verruculosa]|uniref:SNF2 family N-terminal domain-containing protein n=1 Tax=Triangularia verruculosa TaxID=2587418 RepID=A0AAN7ATS8_9PEZI|nr:SNF2 family N-terminal domain-containing protein [Triangularia verruculosa]